VKWQVRLDQVPRLVLQGLKEAEEQSKYRLDPSMIPEEYRGREEDDVAFTRQRGHLILTDLYLATKQPELAREAIRQGLAEIERFDRMPGATSRRPKSYGFLGSEWLTRRARLAEIEGDIPNALSLYQQSLRLVPAEFLEGKDPQSEEITAVKKYYLAHGGKQESWLEWAKAAGGPEPVKLEAPPLEFAKPFPDFEASDLSGKIWRLADLKGRVTLIDVWATWCGPCRGEHRELQSFYDKIKDRKDLQLLTFSTDETEYQVATYMKENQYTFPVIVGKELTEKLFPVVGLPSGWVVNRDAMRSSIFHFRGADRTLKELEKVAGTR